MFSGLGNVRINVILGDPLLFSQTGVQFLFSRLESPTFVQRGNVRCDANERTLNIPMQKHEHLLNLDQPSLNRYGMLWFRDNDVEIGESMHSVLTIYQPLYDARDQNLIGIPIDINDPPILHHTHPTVPMFMYRDFEKMHVLDGSDGNPGVFSMAREQHKKHATKIKSSKQLKMQKTSYELPVSVATKSFDTIKHSGLKIKKHYRTIPIPLMGDKKIGHFCASLWWEVMIDGETTDFPDEEDINAYEDADERMLEKSKDLGLSTTPGYDGEDPEDPDAISVDTS